MTSLIPAVAGAFEEAWGYVASKSYLNLFGPEDFSVFRHVMFQLVLRVSKTEPSTLPSILSR